MNMTHRLLSIVGASLLLLSNSSAAKTCAESLDAHIKADLALPFKEFDQEQGAGWRALADAECYLEAAELINRYIVVQREPDKVLFWHQAQSLAFGGKNKEAAKIGKAHGLRPAADVKRLGYRWNVFALATIAYWEADKEEFMRQKAVLTSAIANEPDVPAITANKGILEALTNLEQCFDAPYAKAVHCKP